MRVLRTQGSDREDWVPRLCTHRGQPYAILSHRWLEDSNHEVLFADIEEIDQAINKATPDTCTAIKNPQYAGVFPGSKPGFEKLQGAARQALTDGYDYIWIDTCCIDKSSSSELSEAINSMWTWYKASNICYAYLVDVPDNTVDIAEKSLFASQWWKRGWTLQELLAPTELKFFSSIWKVIGHKKYLDRIIFNITGINPNVINGTLALESISIAQRMSWASGRTTTRVEDMAYSLMGLFTVNMPLLYGEGERAFLRLQQEIMKDSDDETIFAWKDESINPQIYSGLLAARPSAFASSGKILRYQDAEHRAPYTMTNKGLSITLRLAQSHDGLFAAMLHCTDPEAGAKSISIYLKKVSETSEQYARVRCQEWARYEAKTNNEAKTIYVRQSHDQEPAHKNLGKFNSSIRLLRLVPTQDASTVRVRLMEADIETSRYTVISYVWGGREHLSTIWVNSEPYRVTDSVFRFLQKARQKLTDELFWVDSVCIRQSDRHEKSHQDTIMHQITSHATKVVIWLEKVATEYTRLQPLVHRQLTHCSVRVQAGFHGQLGSRSLATDATPTHESYNYETNRTLLAIKDIAGHPYWRRAWTVQALASARDVTIELETFNLDIEVLTHIYRDTLSVVRHKLHYRDDLAFMGRMLDFYQKRKGHQHAASNALPQFGTLLTTFQFQECTRPRDLVYVLVGVSDLAPRLRIDYEESSIEVFFNVATCLGKDITLNILPLLLKVLEIKLCDRPLTVEDSETTPLRYEIEQRVYPIVNADVQNAVSPAGPLTNNLGVDELAYLSLEDSAKSGGGLVFTRAGSQPLQRTMYRPSKLYIRDTSGRCSFIDLPSICQQAMMDIQGLLDDTTKLAPRLRIIADRKGLLALGFCLQSTSHSLPPIFEYTKRHGGTPRSLTAFS